MFAKKLVKILCYRFERKTTKVALVRLLAKKFRRRNVSARERNASAIGWKMSASRQPSSALCRIVSTLWRIVVAKYQISVT